MNLISDILLMKGGLLNGFVERNEWSIKLYW